LKIIFPHTIPHTLEVNQIELLFISRNIFKAPELKAALMLLFPYFFGTTYINRVCSCQEELHFDVIKYWDGEYVGYAE
jgi:hypothetical protein